MNRRRDQAPRFTVRDKVWLSLRNIRTKRLSKKLDVKNAKYTVTKVISSHSYELDTPPGVYNVFHVQLLRSAATDPLLSQRTTNQQPQPEFVDNELEYRIDEILANRLVRRGRGQRREYLVKWSGYAEPTWEPSTNLEETAALESYLARTSAT